MSEVKWIKITTNVFDDEKIRLVETLPESDTLIIIWFKLLTMAGRCNDCGMVYLTREIPYNEEMLSTILRRPVNTIRLALSEFIKLGMIEIINNFISIVNWEKHQTLDKYEIVKLQNRERKQLQRQKLKQISDLTNVTGQSRDVTQEIRLDKTRLDKTRKEIQCVFDFWNSMSNLKKHKVIKPHESEIKKQLEIYGVEMVKKGIQKYNDITNLPGSFFSYKWILKDFLRRGLDRFVDDAPDDSYRKLTDKDKEDQRIEHLLRGTK